MSITEPIPELIRRLTEERDAARAGERGAQTDRLAWEQEALKAKAEVAPLRERIAQLASALTELVDIVEGVMDGDGRLDSFTLQPARAALGTPVAPKCAVCGGSGRHEAGCPEPVAGVSFPWGFGLIPKDSGAPNASLPEPSSAGGPPRKTARPTCKRCGDIGKVLAEDEAFATEPCPDCAAEPEGAPKPTCATCGDTENLGTKDYGYGEVPQPCPDCQGKVPQSPGENR